MLKEQGEKLEYVYLKSKTPNVCIWAMAWVTEDKGEEEKMRRKHAILRSNSKVVSRNGNR